MYGFEAIVAEKDTPEWRELERQAYNNTIDMEQFRYCPEKYVYFDKLREASHQYKQDGDKERLNRIRNNIYAEYEAYKLKAVDSAAMYRWLQDNVKKCSELKIEINKTDDRDAKLELALKIISILTDDDVFYNSNVKTPDKAADTSQN